MLQHPFIILPTCTFRFFYFKAFFPDDDNGALQPQSDDQVPKSSPPELADPDTCSQGGHGQSSQAAESQGQAESHPTGESAILRGRSPQPGGLQSPGIRIRRYWRPSLPGSFFVSSDLLILPFLFEF